MAISDRTMITNTGASEILQPEDRRLLWQQAQSGLHHASERDVPFVLANGMIVSRSCCPVESDGYLVGIVLHLQVAPPARARLARFPCGRVARAGPHLRSYPPHPGRRPAHGLVQPDRLRADRG